MKIGIIGCGNMGQALLRGIRATAFTPKSNILVSDRDRKKAKLARLKFKLRAASSNSELFKKCDVIILAVKPQDVGVVLRDAPSSLKGKLLISICAGITTKRLERRLGKVSIVRVMPNMPAQIGQGISALSLGRYAKPNDKRIAKSIFSCIGEVVEVKEQWMNAVTAISGSGPAYFFYLVEILIKAARTEGIPEHIAQKLARKTALGSAMLAEKSLKKKALERMLRKRVASKGGTTEAAFKIFEKKKALENLLLRGFRAAAKRSKELERKG